MRAIDYLGSMKHFFTFLILVVSLTAYGQQTSEADQKRIDFVNEFVAAVKEHDSKKVLKMMDKTYRKEQVKFLEGNKEQFINELFGGVDVTSGEYINTKFKHILRIEVAEVEELSQTEFAYTFRIRDGKHDILRQLLLRKDGKRFGFEGSRG